MRRAAGLLSYRLLAVAGAWDRVAAELSPDLGTEQALLPGRDTLRDALAAARLMACTPAEAARMVKEDRGPDAEPVTAEGEYRLLRRFLERWVDP
jgi:hypothetical protein